MATDRIAESGRKSTTAPAVVGGHDIDATVPQVGGVVDRGDGPGGRARPGVGEKLQRKQRNLPVDAHHTTAIVAHRTDRASHVGPVTVAVLRIIVIGDKVPAADIVDKAVAVVVDAVACDLAGVPPDIGSQVGMADVNPRIDDTDHHTAGARGDIPGLGGVDIGVGQATRLPGVGEAPEL